MRDRFSSETIDWLWKISIAQILIISLFLLSLTSFYFPMTGQIRPYFILMVIYYWAIYRPTLLHPFFLFVLGVVLDLILNFPLGLHSVLFLAVKFIIQRQRLFFMGQSYAAVWLGFGLTCLGVITAEWLFFSVYLSTFISLTPLIFSLLLTLFLFPLFSFIFILVHRILPVPTKLDY